MLDALAVPGLRELMLRSGQEALDTGPALGFRPMPIFGLTPAEVAEPTRIVEVLLDTLYAGFVRPGATTTILHDWQKGRRSEAEDINGEVVAAQVRLGGRAPVNAAVVEIAHRIERRELLPGPGNLELLADLAARSVEPGPAFSAGHG
jgi:2-dehydropantoate 2-reductase